MSIFLFHIILPHPLSLVLLTFFVSQSFCRCVIMALVFGTVYMDAPTGNDFLAYKNRYSFAFFSLFFNVIVQMQTIPLYFEDRIMFTREKASKLYYPLVYWFAVWVWYIQFLEVHALVFLLLAYFIAGFQYVAAKIFLFYVTILLSSLTGYLICQVIAASSPNAQTAMGIYPMVVFTNLLFTGYFQYISHMQPWLQCWAPIISFARWGYQAIVVSEFSNNPLLGSDSSYYLQMFDFTTPGDWQCVAILLVFISAFWCMLICTLSFVSFEKR